MEKENNRIKEEENLVWHSTPDEHSLMAFRDSKTEENIVIAYLKDTRTGVVEEVRVRVANSESLAEIREINKRLDNGLNGER